MNLKPLFLVFLLHSVRALLQNPRTIITVQPDCTAPCHHEASGSSCCSIEDAFHILRSNNSQIIIKKLSNTLTNSTKLPSGLSDVLVAGLNTQVSIICFGSASIGFYSILKLYLENISIIGCGSLNRDGSIAAALVVESCIDVTVKSILIKESLGLGLTLSQVTGKVLVKDSDFTGNTGHPITPTYFGLSGGGGGVKINLKDINAGADYLMTGCKFENNSKLIGGWDGIQAKGYGGGLEINLSGRLALSFKILNCTFNDNKAENGGGLAAQVQDCTNTILMIENTSFTGNVALNSVIPKGGAIHYSLSKGLGQNTLLITGCRFISNSAYFGGGLSIETQHNLAGNEISISKCIWTRNEAISGSAVDISHQFSDSSYLIESRVMPVFSNCTFRMNFARHAGNMAGNSLEASYGAVSIMNINVEFYSSLLFEENKGSGLTATMSYVHFKACTALFRNNVGTFGGAVSLNVASLVLHSPSTVLRFIGNKATEFGGALFSSVTNDHMLFSKAVCPFLFDCNKTNDFGCLFSSVTFTHNRAKNGSSIFLSSLLPCRIAYSSKTESLIKPSAVFKRRQFVFFNSTLKNEIATAPSHAHPKHKWISIYPGELCYLDVSLTDELNATIPTNLAVFQVMSIYYPRNVNESVNVTVKNAYIYNNTFTILGPQNITAYIKFQTITKPMLLISRTVHLKFCPPGFYYTKVHRKCICSKFYFYGIVECKGFHAYIVRGAWGGFIEDSLGTKVFVSGPCLFFCHYREKYSQIIPSYFTAEDSFLCKFNRQGILCGQCKLGHTTYYHTSTHYICEPVRKYCLLYGWLIFVVSEILPITVVFVAIIATGLDVTSGYFQGFLLYSHILCSLTISRANRLSRKEYGFYWNFLHLLYFPLNLEFFYLHNTAFCISNDANSLDIASLGYIKGLYCVALIFVIVFFLRSFSRCFYCCSRFLRFTTAKNSALIGMSALFVLFFTSAVETSLLILQPAPLYKEYFEITSYRVALYGKEVYFGLEHLKYAVPAILFLIILFIPTVMLLMYPLVSLFLSHCNIDASQSWVGSILTCGFMYRQLKPFYDRFYASFKDDHRYFAGMYFVYRMIIQLSYYIPNYIESEF
uniref:Right handed beta helix domain-containing protein n=1 Tax=Amphimedon queenslandica TaxID=400682 RepID=A0A1X7UGC2_AMPQE